MESDDIRCTDLLDGVSLRVLTGDAGELLKTLPDNSVNCCVTSPPYWGLRDYGHAGQLGLERTPQEYVDKMTEIFREVRRVLRGDGTLWLNLGDTYNAFNAGAGPGGWAGQERRDGARPKLESGYGLRDKSLKEKDLIGIPWRTALALQADGWYLRSDIIWQKPNPMPESVKDRPTKSHEYIFLMAKTETYYYAANEIAEPTVCDRMRGPSLHRDLKSTNGNDGLSRRPIGETRNRRTVWTVQTQGYRDAHFATFPPELIKPCVLAGCPEGGIVLDPFAGSGTTGMVALELGRRALLCELNPDYVKLINKRTNVTQGFALPSNIPDITK
jgi:DNA modification methylase